MPGSLLELTLAWLTVHVLLLQDRAPVCLSLDPLCPVQGWALAGDSLSRSGGEGMDAAWVGQYGW